MKSTNEKNLNSALVSGSKPGTLNPKVATPKVEPKANPNPNINQPKAEPTAQPKGAPPIPKVDPTITPKKL